MNRKTNAPHSFVMLPAFLLFLCCLGSVGFSQPGVAEQPRVPDDYCITRDEYRLYQLINDFRKKNGLPVIPISSALSYVARVHVLDLHHNRPDTSYCSLNSWSDKGSWSSCCHSKATPSPKCILGKPSELTGYPGEGHELCYYDNIQASPDSIMAFFASLPQSAELLLNRSKWSFYQWKSVGVAIDHNYASIWFGEVADRDPEPGICTSKNGYDLKMTGK